MSVTYLTVYTLSTYTNFLEIQTLRVATRRAGARLSSAGSPKPSIHEHNCATDRPLQSAALVADATGDRELA